MIVTNSMVSRRRERSNEERTLWVDRFLRTFSAHDLGRLTRRWSASKDRRRVEL